MTFKEVLHKFRTQSFTEKEKGTKFERLMQRWLQTDPRFNQLTTVWLWEEFPARGEFGGKDTGIDLVAKTELGDYWAIQCKCYAESASIDKPAVDSFLATSSRTFHNELTFQTTRFAARIWISTTNKWGPNAEETIQNQDPPVSRISLVERVEDFILFERAGRQLAELHLNYDKFDGKTVEFPDYVTVDYPTPPAHGTEEEYAFFAVERDVKMQFQKVRNEAGKLVADKSTIIFNPRIHVRNIPPQAYEYIVNGKSAVEWVIERYAITIDSASQIMNNPNDWAREHNDPQYILNVLLSVIDLSVKTVDIVNNLPHLTFTNTPTEK